MQNESTTEEKNFLGNFLFHAETVLTNRTNFFLVAQSMFVVAYASLIEKGQHFILFHLIAWGGLIVSILWLLLGIKIYIRLRGASREVAKIFPIYKNLFETYDFPIASNKIIAFTIPALFIIGWAILICRF